MGVSKKQPGARKPGNEQFSNVGEVSAQKKQGNLNKLRNRNGNIFQGPANVSGVLPAECLRYNGGHVKPPADGFSFTVTIVTPNHTSGPDTTDPNDGTKTLVKRASGHGPNITVPKGVLNITVSKGVPTITVSKRVPNITVSKVVPNITVSKGVPKHYSIERVPNITVWKGVPNITISKGVQNITVSKGVPNITVSK